MFVILVHIQQILLVYAQIKEPIELAPRKDLRQEDTHLSILQMPNNWSIVFNSQHTSQRGHLKGITCHGTIRKAPDDDSLH